MNKLLVICGPTAAGKTVLALTLAKKLARGPSTSDPKGEIISADSRQIYRGMDIGTGKDLPVNIKYQISNIKSDHQKIIFYEMQGVKIWGYDLVEPTQEFSVSQYSKIAKRIIKNIQKRGKLPILVGGTGFYIKALVDGIETINIPQNSVIRNSLANKTSNELFEILANLDPIKAACLNMSDKKNPRRLVRAIEVATARVKERESKRVKEKRLNSDCMFIGLSAPREDLYKRIDQRVEERVRAGIEDEIIKLLKKGLTWKSQSMTALGYREWNGRDRKTAIDQWKKDEHGFARRQITWFKKDKRINWFNITQKDYQKRVELLVEKWYYGSGAEKN